MQVSVVIPTLNAESLIGRLVLCLRRQTIPPEEIIVIDSSSEDQTVKLAAEMGCRTVVIERKSFDHGGTRNLGAELSKGEVLVFMTQDALPVDEKLLEHLVAPLVEPQGTLVAAAFARQVPKESATPPEKFARLFNYPEEGAIKDKSNLPRLGIKTFFFSDVCSAVRRREFEAVGGFPTRVIMNEDMILAAKLILAGYKVAYVPEAMVWHSHELTLAQQFKRYFDIGASLNMNKWLLEHAKAEGEGFRFVKKQLAWLLLQGHYRWVPHVLASTVAKYAGYRLGLMQDKLPAALKRRLSQHSYFWGQR